MTAQYDIFKKTPNGDFVWVEAVEDITCARKRLIQVAATNLLTTDFGTAPARCSWSPWKTAPALAKSETLPTNASPFNRL